jgi:F420-0:gamma-glutamyl ligase-like protein
MDSNKTKELIIEVDNEKYIRQPIKTCLIVKESNIIDVVKEYTQELLQDDDIVFISEKAVAITQQRAYKLTDIHPRKLAYFLSKHVTKTSAGIGLGMPETMEMALRECGILRILFAACMSAVCKIFKIKGVFYVIAGRKAASIDGPTQNTIPPYNQYVVLGPKNANQVAKEISDAISAKVAIVDINDLGGNILGISHKTMDRKKLVRILKDNPLGQSREQTPVGIIRKQTLEA